MNKDCLSSGMAENSRKLHYIVSLQQSSSSKLSDIYVVENPVWLQSNSALNVLFVLQGQWGYFDSLYWIANISLDFILWNSQKRAFSGKKGGNFRKSNAGEICNKCPLHKVDIIRRNAEKKVDSIGLTEWKHIHWKDIRIKNNHLDLHSFSVVVSLRVFWLNDVSHSDKGKVQLHHTVCAQRALCVLPFNLQVIRRKFWPFETQL